MRMVVKVLEEVREGEILDLVEEGKETETITEKMKKAVKVQLEQEIQSKWTRIDRSKYCKEKRKKELEEYTRKKEQEVY